MAAQALDTYILSASSGCLVLQSCEYLYVCERASCLLNAKILIAHLLFCGITAAKYSSYTATECTVRQAVIYQCEVECLSVMTEGMESMVGCSLLVPLCVSVKMKVTQIVSQRYRPLHPRRPSSLLSWQHSSLLPMTMRKMLGVVMSTKCCQIQMVPLLFTPFMCSPNSFR